MMERKTDLSKQCWRLLRKVSSPEEAGESTKKCLELVTQHCLDNLELTDVTAPYMIFALENICKMLEGVIDEEERMLIAVMRVMYHGEITTISVPRKVDLGEEDT